jgi:hypothetical protein
VPVVTGSEKEEHMGLDLSGLSARFHTVPGIRAVALGGSRSRDEVCVGSDYDIGLYYDADKLDTHALAACLTELDDGHRTGLLQPPGAWGPWINGGAWLSAGGEPVDFLLRDLARVEAVVTDCLEGRISIDYQSGHPFGFVNAIYAAETHYCRRLWQDPSAPLDRLKALLLSQGLYPPLLRNAMTAKFLWEAEFSLACGRKAALRGDVNYAAGSVFRAVASWAQVLYALNGCYLMNEKGSLKGAGGLPRSPTNLEVRVTEAYRLLSCGDAAAAWTLLERLHGEVADIEAKE